MLKEINHGLFILGSGLIFLSFLFPSSSPPTPTLQDEIEIIEEMSFLSIGFWVSILLFPFEWIGVKELLEEGFLFSSASFFLLQYPLGLFFLPHITSLSLTSSSFSLLISSLLFSSHHPYLGVFTLIISFSLLSFSSILLLLTLSTTLFALIFSIIRFIFLSFLCILLRIPLLRSLLLRFFSFIFFFWFFSLILFEKYLRTILTSLTSSLSLSGVPFSLVNAPDPSFTSFPCPPSPLPPSPFPPSSLSLPLLKNTLSLANIAKFSYEKSQIVQEIGEKYWFFDKVYAIKFKTTSAFIFCSGDVIVVSFRGTSPLNLGQIVTDIAVHMQAFPKLGLVHWGFLDALFTLPSPHSLHSPSSPVEQLEEMLPRDSYLGRFCIGACCWVGKWVEWVAERIRSSLGIHQAGKKYQRTHSAELLSCFEQVCQKIKDIEKEDGTTRKKKTIFVTGHSLGGALATLFVAKALSEGMFEDEEDPKRGKNLERLGKLGGLYTFGAPKVGNVEFGELFYSISDRVFRVVLRYDIVPHVPTTNMAQTAHQMAHWLQSSIDTNVLFEEPTSTQQEEEQVGYVHPPGQFLFLSRGALLIDPSSFEMARALVTGLLDWKLFEELKNESSLRRLFRITLPFFINDHLPGDYVNHLSQVLKIEQSAQH